MKRWQAVALWFAANIAFGLITDYKDGGYGIVYAILHAISDMTSPVLMVLTLVAMLAIWKKLWERKSLADRMQTKSAQTKLEDK